MKKDSPLSVGFDLGGHTAKAVVLDFSGQEPVLKGFKKFLVSKEGHFLPRTELAGLIRENLEVWADESGKFVMAVSGKDVIVRYMEMPKMGLTELKNSLKYEAERILPFKLADAYFDTEILQTPAEAGKKMWVILVAAKKAVVDDRIQILKESGITPTCIDVEAASLINAYQNFCSPGEEKKGVFLIDIGAFMTITNILAGGIPFLSREIDFGGEPLTQALLKEGLADYEKAEAAKFEGKISWEGPVSKLLKPFVKEIKSSFDYFEASSDKTVEKVLLTGGSAPLRGFAHYLSAQINRPVEVFSPGANLKKELFSGYVEEFNNTSHHYAGALGLAVRGRET